MPQSAKFDASDQGIKACKDVGTKIMLKIAAFKRSSKKFHCAPKFAAGCATDRHLVNVFQST